MFISRVIPVISVGNTCDTRGVCGPMWLRQAKSEVMKIKIFDLIYWASRHTLKLKGFGSIAKVGTFKRDQSFHCVKLIIEKMVLKKIFTTKATIFLTFQWQSDLKWMTLWPFPGIRSSVWENIPNFLKEIFLFPDFIFCG